MSMPTLSVCCLAKNEETLIADMIASVRDLDAEIIVLDTGSSDNTVARARDLGARVETFEWKENFADARNALLRHARGEWIFMLDADERLEEESLPQVQGFLESPTAHALQCTVFNELPHPIVRSLLPLPSVRIFRYHEDFSYQNRVHETLDNSLRHVTWSALNSDIKIRHIGYVAGDRRKLLRNRRVFESAAKNDPTESWVRLHLGLTYFLCGEDQQAQEYLTNAVSSSSGDITKEARSILLSFLAEIESRNPDTRLHARSLALKAMQMGGNLYSENLLASLDVQEELYESAIKRYLALDASSLTDPFFLVHRGAMYAEIAKAYLKLKEIDKALEYCELAMDKPSYDAMFIGGYLSEQKKQYQRALEFYEIAKKLAPKPADIIKRISAVKQALDKA